MKRSTLIIIISVLSAIAIAAVTALLVIFLNNDNGNKNNEKITYTVTLVRSSGDPFVKANVLAYDSDGELESFASTNENGVATFEAPAGEYTLQFGMLPDGYPTEGNYKVDKNSPAKTFKLAASLLTTPADEKTAYTIGDVMHDFEFTDTDGNKSSLSKVLETKKAVLLNFWFVNCSWCVKEFPGMANAYSLYQDDIEVIAINIQDTVSEINNFRENKSGGYDWQYLPFTMVPNTNENIVPILVHAFNIGNYPTSIMIDREGVICFFNANYGTESEFADLFTYFSEEPYIQKIYFDGKATLDKPDVTAPTSAEISNTIDNLSTGFSAKYSFDDDEYNWPWIIENGELKTSNKGHNNSYAIMYVDVTAAKGSCIAFDYQVSSEYDADLFTVSVNGLVQKTYSGISPVWETCYAYVPLYDGEYTLALIYQKDLNQSRGEDTVKIKNMRFINETDINTYTEIIYPAASGEIVNNEYSNYIDTVYNENDGYYHVGTTDGPLVLANLMAETNWSNQSVWQYIVDNGGLIYDFDEDGQLEDYTDYITTFCSYSSNATKYGFIGVTYELKYYLDVLTQKFSEANENSWLELCYYYKLYSNDGGNELEDPITGLSFYTALPTLVSTKDATILNHVNKQTVIMPRGIWYEFTPDETAVYKIHSVDGKYDKVDTYCWILNEDLIPIVENDDDPEMYADGTFNRNFAVTQLFEKSRTYYVLVDFNSTDTVGEFDFVIEKLSATGYIFTAASANEYSFLTDENGELYVDENNNFVFILRGVDYVADENNIYCVKTVLGKPGAKIYINMTDSSNMFPNQSFETMLDISCYYCKACGSKYHNSVGEFENEEAHFCYVCGNTDHLLFEKKATFELPEPIRDDTGKIRLVRFEWTDSTTDESTFTYVPMYKLNATQIDYTDPSEYLKDLKTYGIKFTDYTSVIKKYVDLANNNYPTVEEVSGINERPGYVEANKELIDVLQAFIVFGDYSLSPNIDNCWLFFAKYYMYLG